jgi:CRISPR-associated protein Csc3
MDWEIFGFTYPSDSSEVLKEYIERIANEKLLYYKGIIHYGGKTGESLWAHVMNLVTTIEKVRDLFELNAEEYCCLLLAITIHDINKLDPYGKLPNGKTCSYANAASLEHIKQELESLEVKLFFPEWQDHLYDITYLAHGHQVMSRPGSQSNQNFIKQCKLQRDRLEGPLRHLMKFADAADNSHSGDYTTRDEKNIRGKLVQHMNAALNAHVHPRRFRFVGHRLAELRGIETNVMHNQIVTFLQDRYGKEACIDLLYHPTGVDYLLDKNIQLDWSAQDLRVLAHRIGQKFAELQSNQLAQFIKAKPSGISVDDAAIQSGAPLSDIFLHMRNIAERKQYKLEWREQRDAFARQDLESFLTEQSGDPNLQERIGMWLRKTSVVPSDEKALQRGEFLMAYRNFLKDHREEQLKVIKQDAWDRVARLYQIPAEHDAIYNLIDPYRRGYCMARDLPACSLDTMMDDALADLAQLEKQASQVVRKGKKHQVEIPSDTESNGEEAPVQAFDEAYLVDYLERNLDIWDSVAPLPAQSIDFSASLRRYVDSKRPHTQCCYCGSTLQAGEWMAIQVPPNIGVQSFSNRLEAGTSREPKRNVCDVCRIQFILEKLAWRSHRDKQGSEQVTFYLHCFPYSFFTQPLLLAWWQSIDNLRRGDHTSLFLDTRSYFSDWGKIYRRFHEKVRFTHRGLEGISIPAFSEALSNTPILPLIIGKSSGKSYGHKFLVALEKAVLLSLWFDCRIILSRLPTPLLNLENERVDNEPVALLVENVPQVMSWLLSINPEASSNALTRSDVDALCQKLQGLHQIAEKLTTNGEDFYSLIYDLISAASTDPLELYHETDRYIERFVAQKKSRSPEHQAINLSQAIAPIIEKLLNPQHLSKENRDD